jgi:hypothetical protein
MLDIGVGSTRSQLSGELDLQEVMHLSNDGRRDDDDGY